MRWLIKGYDALMANGDPAGELDDANLPPKMLQFKVAMLYLNPKMKGWLTDFLSSDVPPDERMKAEEVWLGYRKIYSADKPNKDINREDFMDTLRLYCNSKLPGSFVQVPRKEPTIGHRGYEGYVNLVGWGRREFLNPGQEDAGVNRWRHSGQDAIACGHYREGGANCPMD
jgi:hypothetical protein